MSDYKFYDEDFHCYRGTYRIIGRQFIPKINTAGEKAPAIIISHGFGGNYHEGEAYARAFAKTGCAVFCFSFCGGTNIDTDASCKSEGLTIEMTIGSEVNDLITVKDYIKSLPYIDTENISLMGFSQGGFVSGLAAAKCEGEIKRLIMVFPALCIPDHARRGCLGGASYDVNLVPDIIDCGGMKLGRAFHEEAAAMDPYLEIRRFTGPVLIIHGYEDCVVDYTYSVKAVECYNKDQCSLQLMHNMGHGMDPEQQESIIASVRQFLAGRREILTFRIYITHVEKKPDEKLFKQDVFFQGYCASRLFHGVISPEGVDSQEFEENGNVKLHAVYTLQGLDYTGKHCSLQVDNQMGSDDWKPVIKTDSEALSWLNTADLTAVLEFNPEGPTVRIFNIQADRYDREYTF